MTRLLRRGPASRPRRRSGRACDLFRNAVLLVALAATAASGCVAHTPPASAGTASRTPAPALDPWLRRLAADPDDVEARLGLAAARRHAGDLEGALLEVHKALVSDPRSAPAHLERARIYYDRGLVEREIEAYRAALALDPSGWEARENLGHALVAAGRPTEAAVEYRSLLDARPDAPAALFNLARILGDAGQAAEALALWKRFLVLESDGRWAEQARAEAARLEASLPPSAPVSLPGGADREGAR